MKKTEQIEQIIDNGVLSEAIPTRYRLRYTPYKMNYALKCFYLIGKRLNPSFKMDRQTVNVAKRIIKYVHADKTFNGNLLAPIGIFGNVGSGKTTLFQIMTTYMTLDKVLWVNNGKTSSFNFRIHSALEIFRHYSSNGFDGLLRFIIPNIICIDDLGAEENIASHYGNKINAMGYIVEERYLKGKITCFSAN